MKLEQYYDKRFADETVRTFNAVSRPTNRYEATIKFVSPPKGSEILEIGAGNGSIARGLMDNGLSFKRYVLSDLSDIRLATARDVVSHPKVEFMKLDIENDSLDDKFDAIIMVALIEHLIDPLGAMKTLRQNLAPGGFVYINTPNIAKWTRRLKLLAGRFPSTASKNEGLTGYDNKPVDLYDESHLHYFTFRSLSLMLTEYCGFSYCKIAPYYEGHRFAPRQIEYALARIWPQMFSEVSILAYA